MIIITSAAYLGQELGSEFGHIPPAFLPIGNKRLFVHQRKTLPSNERTVLTIPENFIVSDYDKYILKKNAIELLEIPAGLTLGNSVVCALNLLGCDDKAVKILHGDTLVNDIEHEQYDVISVSEVSDNYNWAIFHHTKEKILWDLSEAESIGEETCLVANGYFSFSNSSLLLKSIIHSNGDFISGINEYAKQIPIKSISCNSWLDFGHVHTYFRSKSEITTQREFNNMDIGIKTVKKSSHKKHKMQAEANWFKSLPGELKLHTPHLVSSNKNGYEIEYLYLSSLNELFVFGRLPFFSWKKILHSCFEFLELCENHTVQIENGKYIDSTDEYFIKKTKRRLIEFSKQGDIDINGNWIFNDIETPSLLEIAEETAKFIPDERMEALCVSHGDFCFSNILFDFRTQLVQVIDPRGYNANEEISIYGNQNYDLAKLAHSIIGLYDFIIAGYYNLTVDENRLKFYLPDSSINKKIKDTFTLMVKEKYSINKTQLNSMQVHLFLSMLPLHKDDKNRQMALLANAIRLYLEIKEEQS